MQLLPTHRDQVLSLDLYLVMKDEVKVAPQKALFGRWRNHICWVGDQIDLWLGRQLLVPWHPRKTGCSDAPATKVRYVLKYTKAFRGYVHSTVDAWKVAFKDYFYVHSAYDYLKLGTLRNWNSAPVPNS